MLTLANLTALVSRQSGTVHAVTGRAEIRLPGQLDLETDPARIHHGICVDHRNRATYAADNRSRSRETDHRD